MTRLKQVDIDGEDVEDEDKVPRGGFAKGVLVAGWFSGVPSAFIRAHRTAHFGITITKLKPGDYPSWNHGCRWSFTAQSTGVSCIGGGSHFSDSTETLHERLEDGRVIDWPNRGVEGIRDSIRYYLKEWTKESRLPVNETTLMFYSEHPDIKLSDFAMPNYP